MINTTSEIQGKKLNPIISGKKTPKIYGKLNKIPENIIILGFINYYRRLIYLK
jgi:hypothetical protein